MNRRRLILAAAGALSLRRLSGSTVLAAGEAVRRPPPRLTGDISWWSYGARVEFMVCNERLIVRAGHQDHAKIVINYWRE